MTAFIYFMKLFDIEYFEKISQKCAGNKSLSQLIKNAAPLYFRAAVVPMMVASLYVYIASHMPHWILMGIFLIEALGFIAVFCAGIYLADVYTDPYACDEPVHTPKQNEGEK